jgi:FkbM family methyltransferase
MSTVRDFFHRLRDRLGWILGTAQLGADLSSQAKLLLGGFWFFINDSWKSNLRFAAEIEQFGRSLPFYFEDIGDFGLFCEIFRSEAYEQSLPEKANVIFDLGANVGVAALYLRLRYPESAIYCFEPDPSNVRRLRNQAVMTGNIRVYNVALWSSNESLSFYVDPHRGSLSSVSSVHDRQQKINVEARTLDSLLQEENIREIDLLKFDIEGAEEEVLTTFDCYDKVNALFGELHADFCDADAVFRTLDAHFDAVRTTPLEIDDRWYVTARRTL